MNLYEYHTVENMVKYKDHDWYRTPNPHDWLWSDDGTGFWQPIRRK